MMIERIRNLMSESNIKQKDLVQYLNESQSTVSKWLSKNESIRNDIPNTILLKISKLLNVDVEYLMGMQTERLRGEPSSFSIVPIVGKLKNSTPFSYDAEKFKGFPVTSIFYVDGMYVVTNDSTEMTPDYKIGDIIFCKYGDVLPSDNLVVHYHYNGQSGIRICKMDENSTSVALTPLNLEEHKIIFIPKERRKDLKLAKVVGLFRSEP